MTYQMTKSPHPSRGYRIDAEGAGVSYAISVYRVERGEKGSRVLDQDSDSEAFASKLAEAVNSLA